MPFNGMGLSLGTLSRLSPAKSRSISAENPTGGKGMGAMAEPRDPARSLGRGWKCRPTVEFGPGQTVTLADLDGPGVIQSIWMTTELGRDLILRFFWEGQDRPSVECPLPDFFAVPWSYAGRGTLPTAPFAQLASLPVAVNPYFGLNCFWEMPFRKHCRITAENQNPEKGAFLYYQMNYALTEVPEDAALFHAQFRRVNPLRGGIYTILDGVRGRGTTSASRWGGGSTTTAGGEKAS